MKKAKKAKKTTHTRDIEVNWTINQQATNMRNRVREREGQIHIQHNYNPPGNVLNTEYQMQGWRGTPELADHKRRKKSHKEHTLNKNGNGTLHHLTTLVVALFVPCLVCLPGKSLLCVPLSHHIICVAFCILCWLPVSCLVLSVYLGVFYNVFSPFSHIVYSLFSRFLLYIILYLLI